MNERNKPCYCNSGKKYKNCHGKAEEPFAAKLAQLRQRLILKLCLHHDRGDGCSKIASAHTIQRSRILDEITSVDNHVLTFYPPDFEDDGLLKMHRRGWKTASTFTGFCSVHDDAVFAALEKSPFVASTEQVFLLFYKAVCWELFQKQRMCLASLGEVLDPVGNQTAQKYVEELVAAQDAGFQRGYEEAVRFKESMDAFLISVDFSQILHWRIQISGDLCIASTGAVTPNFDLNGSDLQTLHDDSTDLQYLGFAIDTSSDVHSLIFCWSRDHAAANRFVDSVNSLTDQELLAFLPQFIFSFFENTYFSESWWNGLAETDRNYLQLLMSNSNPYYSPPQYDLTRTLIPWEIVSR